ncbi:MAG TPA: hypothetical protein VLA04_00200 [Verrucomicrobiae bacterium]|nr:hypothetical protein [Verrucomicrobiae bacterium]
MKKLTVLSIAGLLVLAFLAIAPVRAEEGDSSTSGSREKTAAQRAEKRAKAAAERHAKAIEKCEDVQLKVESRFEENKKLEGAHREQHEKLVTKISSIITRAQAAGYSTTDLEAKLTTLKAMVADYQADKTTYLASLTTTEDAVCGKSKDELKVSVEAARTGHEALRADVKAIHAYIKSDVKPAVKELKKKVSPSASPTSSPSAE